MAGQTNPAGDKQFSEIISRIFTDEKFAQGLEHKPEQTLRDAGFKLDDSHVKALHANAAETSRIAATAAADPNVAAFVRPVVSVLTKGTKPVVSVVVSSAVVATQVKAKDE